MSCYFTASKYTTGGTTTLLFTSDTVQIGWDTNNTTPVETKTNGVATTSILDPTDRIIVELYVNNNQSGNKTVTFYTEGTLHYSYIVTTLQSPAGTSGSSGINGTSGTSGSSGTSGINGTSGSSGISGTSGSSGTSGTSGTSSTSTLFTGGTVTGATIFTNGLTANTISATTYLNLPTDIRVTGGTYSTGTAVYTNNTGGTFSVTGFLDNFYSGGTITSSDLLTLSNTDALVVGLTYPVIETKFYNGLSNVIVYVKATSPNTIDEENAFAYFYDPKYDTYNIYDTSVQYDNPTYVIWGGLLWYNDINIVLPGANINDYELGGGFNIEGDSSFYNTVVDNVSYNIEDEMVYSRRNHYCNFTCDPNTLLIGDIKIRNMQWGNYYYSGTSLGLRGVNIINSDLNIINKSNILLTEIELFNSFVTVSNNRTLSNLMFVNRGTFASPANIQSSTNNKFLVGDIISSSGLTATTISATTYLNLPLDIRVTGGTYSSGTTIFTNNTGGTFSVTGFSSGGSSQVKLSAQTLSFGSWTLVGSYYEYTFSNANIVSTGFVTFTPNNASINEVSTCRMLPQIDAATGTCKFYSLFPPQTNIVGEIIIFIL